MTWANRQPFQLALFFVHKNIFFNKDVSVGMEGESFSSLYSEKVFVVVVPLKVFFLFDPKTNHSLHRKVPRLTSHGCFDFWKNWAAIFAAATAAV